MMHTLSTKIQSNWLVLVFGWSVCALGVWFWVTSYGFSTYEAGTRAAPAWPANSTITLAGDRPTILVFLHPRCPCSRASIREVERLVTYRRKLHKQPKLIVLVSLPQNGCAGWRDTPTTRQAARLPGATMVWDAGGLECSRFGVITSGTVMVYAPNGAGLFRGGVTASRGHEGDNAGSLRVWSILHGRGPGDLSGPASTPVFGCRLCLADREDKS